MSKTEPKQTIQSLVDHEAQQPEIVKIDKSENQTKPTKRAETSLAEERPPFRPTKLQRKWLQADFELMASTNKEVADHIGCTPQNWSMWIKADDRFIDWYHGEWNKLMRTLTPKLDKIGMRQAKRGQHKFWRDMQSRAGNLNEPSKANNSQNNIQMNVEFIMPD